MHTTESENTASKMPGLLLHKAMAYDLGVWILTFGRERAMRRKILAQARLQAGEAVLDVGCGTGSLAIEAKRQVGPAGTVCGIDGSPEMIARAAKKARKSAFEIELKKAPVQALPFADGCFDAVLSTVMFHHLPRPSRAQCAREMRRVVRAGGRVMVVDFVQSTRKEPIGFLDHLHRHGGVDPNEIAAHLEDAGLKIVARGDVGFRGLHFVLAEAPASA